MGGKMRNAFVFQKFLEGLVVKFFPEIHLQTQGLTSFAAIQNTLKGVGDTFARLVFQRDRPLVFGEHVHDRQDKVARARDNPVCCANC